MSLGMAVCSCGSRFILSDWKLALCAVQDGGASRVVVVRGAFSRPLVFCPTSFFLLVVFLPQVFVELQSKGFFDMLNNMFLGGNGANNPQNFEGGNQGSFFNFMYPHSTDYPWACVCDENSFKKYENKEIEAVPCRNEVDMSAQGVVAFCDPRNHKMNSARPGSSLSWSELFLVLFMPSLLIHLNLLHVSLL